MEQLNLFPWNNINPFKSVFPDLLLQYYQNMIIEEITRPSIFNLGAKNVKSKMRKVRFQVPTGVWKGKTSKKVRKLPKGSVRSVAKQRSRKGRKKA